MAKKNVKTRFRKKQAQQFLRQKMPAEAYALLRDICRIDPRDAEAWYMLGLADQLLGRIEQSINSLETAVRLNSRQALGFYHLGLSYRGTGQHNEAIQAFARTVELDPGFLEGHHRLIQTLTDMGRFSDAAKTLEHLITLAPGNADYRNNLGSVLQAQGDLEGAVSCYRDALTLNPRLTIAMDGLGSALCSLRRFEEAMDVYRKSIVIDPANARGHSNLLLSLNYLDDIPAKQMLLEHVAWGEKYAGPRPIGERPAPVVVGRPVRVGYISPDFREHSVAYFVRPLFEAHDRKRFEVFCYSSARPADEITRQLKSLADHWRDIAAQSVDEIVAWIKRDQIDILVDLSGHTANNHLLVLAKKPAPIQATWLGYPNTTGLAAIDYRIVDDITDPGGYDAYCTEKLIRIAGCFLCYEPPESAIAIHPCPCLEKGYITFGSFNNLAKIGTGVVNVWGKLLLAIPDSRLFIKNRSLSDIKVQREFRRYFEEMGVAEERVLLSGATLTTREHLELYNHLDIALDTFPYNGATTTCEALWMGKPVITLIGDRHASRVGASLLTHAGLPWLVAKSTDEYISLGRKLAEDRESLEGIRLHMRECLASSRLCDRTQFARNMEHAYRCMLND